MMEEQRKILRKFAEQLRRIYPKSRIWAFGSYLHNTETAESDFDVCVVLPQLSPEDRFAVSDIAWEVGFEHDIHLSTIVFSEKEFEQGPVSVSPLIDSILREGEAA